MSQLTKAAKAQKSAILANFRTFNVGAVAVLTAERAEFLQPYFERAAVPAVSASRSALIGWARSNMLPQLPACEGFGGVCFTTNKEKAHTFAEGFDVSAFRNCGELSAEIGAKLAEGAPRSCYFYRVRFKRVPVVLVDNGAAGKVYKVTEDGKSRVFDIVEYREYIAERSDSFSPAELVGAFFSACGIPAAIAAEAAEALQLKAAKAAKAAEDAAARAAATAADAAKRAAAAEIRAAEKAEKAAEVVGACGLTAAERSEILTADAQKQAAKQAEQAEKASKAKGENVRKKANTKTKASEQITK